MTDGRSGGLALILGTAALIVVMALHPTGHQMASAGSAFAALALLNVLVHSLAILALPVLFFGALAWTRIAQTRLSTVALVLYGFALVAGMGAALMSGFVAPDALRQLAHATTPQSQELWRALARYSGVLNQAFARVLAVGAAAAIVCWSASIKGWLRWYGIVSGAAAILLAGSGMLRLDVHGFGAVMILQGIWFMVVGRRMRMA
jgi:hypothetical protein